MYDVLGIQMTKLLANTKPSIFNFSFQKGKLATKIAHVENFDQTERMIYAIFLWAYQ